MTTADLIARVRALDEAATRAPWTANRDASVHRKGSIACERTCGAGVVPESVFRDPTANVDEWNGEREMHVITDVTRIRQIIGSNGESLFYPGAHYDQAIQLDNADLIAEYRTLAPQLAERLAETQQKFSDADYYGAEANRLLVEADKDNAELRTQLAETRAKVEQMRAFVSDALTVAIQRRDVALDRPNGSIDSAWCGGEVQAYSRVEKTVLALFPAPAHADTERT